MKEPPSSTDELEVLAQKIHTVKGHFEVLINRAGQDLYKKIQFPKDLTFPQYWNESITCKDYTKSFPLQMVSDLADRIGVGKRL